MVIALSEFECLSGFRHKHEIQELLQEYPEFVSLLHAGGLNIQTLNHLPEEEYLKSMFQTYMNSREEDVQHWLQVLIPHIQQSITTTPPLLTNSSTCSPVSSSPLNGLLSRLYDQYEYDIGVFAPLMLNYLTLQPGQSFFIGPNIPHAYIFGDCIECMALSDNVVRAGLTPKLRDIATLCTLIDYQHVGIPHFIEPVSIQEEEEEGVEQGGEEQGYSNYLYRPPKDQCAEFEVERIEVNSRSTNNRLRSLPCASIALVLQGNEEGELQSSEMIISAITGRAVFIAAGVEVIVQNHSKDSKLLIFRAHVNLGL
jgi:mannose-6-phosphate isomerase